MRQLGRRAPPIDNVGGFERTTADTRSYVLGCRAEQVGYFGGSEQARAGGGYSDWIMVPPHRRHQRRLVSDSLRYLL
jgi:hypothetical protein